MGVRTSVARAACAARAAVVEGDGDEEGEGSVLVFSDTAKGNRSACSFVGMSSLSSAPSILNSNTELLSFLLHCGYFFVCDGLAEVVVGDMSSLERGPGQPKSNGARISQCLSPRVYQ